MDKPIPFQNPGIKIPVLFLYLCIVVMPVIGQQAQPGRTLAVHLSGFQSNTGQALVYLFRQQDKIPVNPFRVVKTTITNLSGMILIMDLPFGDYAIIGVHDGNANGKIDHSWGFPAEPLGYSNHWKLGLLSGMPTFSKLRFSFSENNQTCEIRMPD